MSDTLKAQPSKAMDRRTFVRTIAAGSAAAAMSWRPLNASVYERLAALEPQEGALPSPDGAYWEYVAAQYMLEPGLIMMNNGTAGTMPRPVIDTMTHYWKVQAQNAFTAYSTFDALREEARIRAAQFIRADPDEVALLRNTSEGLAIVAYGLQMKPGDEVLMSDLEHPAGIYPWRLRAKRDGIKIREVKIATPTRDAGDVLEAFDKAIRPETKAILISHATYRTGLIPPLKELCRLAHAKNVLVCADGAHCIGMLDLDMHDLGVDFYANSGYKWLGAPTGTGIFYIRRDVQPQVWPNIVEFEWEKDPSALKYSNFGRSSDPLYIALGEAIRFQSQIRKDRIERRIKTLAAYLKEEAARIPNVTVLSPSSPDLSGGITVLGLKGAPNDQFANYMLEKYNCVVARSIPELNAVRICTHIFLSFKQVDVLLAGLREVYGSK